MTGQGLMRALGCGFLVVMAGCAGPFARPHTGGTAAAWSAISNGAPVRVAVFVDAGARAIGQFRWMQLMDQSPDIVATFVDGEAVRDGALRDVDVLAMPGGKSNLEADALGLDGKREVRRFIREGGAYVGTCAGAFLVMAGTNVNEKTRPLAIAPFKYRRGGWGGEAMIDSKYNETAEKLAGIKKGAHTERFSGGPVMDPGVPVPDTDFQVMATFDCNLHSYTRGPGLPMMAGGASVVAGRFGKGRMWLFAGHPEYYPKTWDSLAGAFKYFTGRKPLLQAPQRRRGALAVGWWCKAAPGPDSARIAMRLVRDPDFDVDPFSNDQIDRTDLRHVDAFVVPHVADEKALRYLKDGTAVKARLVAFMDRGGTIVTWGNTAKEFAPHANLVVAKNGDAAVDALRALKNAPAPAPRAAPAKKVAKPVRAGIYTVAGAGGCAFMRWIKLLSLSPDCTLTMLDDADVRAGKLKDLDLYVAPGGSSATQAATLKAQGRTNLVEFVRNGGGYFGTCAGCYLALSQANEKPIRLGMLPYKRQKSPYRGGAELQIKFTEHAGLFGLKPNATRTVRYHGGPVLEASEQVPGADIREIAVYDCDGVYSYNTNATPVMAGHPALVAGTFGKGRLVGCSPHPESYTHTQDIIRGGLAYITGRAFAAEYPQRTRGNLSVGFLAARLRKDGGQLVADLYREPALDLRAVAGETIGYGELEHCDALVMVHPSKESFTALIKAFAANGGTIVTLGSEKENASVPKDVKNVIACTDGAAVKATLRRLAAEPCAK